MEEVKKKKVSGRECNNILVLMPFQQIYTLQTTNIHSQKNCELSKSVTDSKSREWSSACPFPLAMRQEPGLLDYWKFHSHSAQFRFVWEKHAMSGKKKNIQINRNTTPFSSNRKVFPSVCIRPISSMRKKLEPWCTNLYETNAALAGELRAGKI